MPALVPLLTGPSHEPRGGCAIDTLSVDVEEEALVTLEGRAGAALLAVLPCVPHHLAGIVHLHGIDLTSQDAFQNKRSNVIVVAIASATVRFG